MSGLTESGKRRLADFVKETYQNLGLNQEQFAALIKEKTGIDISESQIRTLCAGHWQHSLAQNVFFALDDSQLLINPESKEPYTIADIANILRDRLDPFTGKAISPEKNGIKS